jgi:hypothetical protein
MEIIKGLDAERDKFLGGVMEYTKKLGLTFDWDGCVEVYKEALEGESVKSAVWYYLDTYEGIAHSRDPEFWKDREEEEECD